MKAVQIVKPNDLRIIDMDKPTIDAKNNVLVKIKAAGICGSDVGIYHGTNAAATYPRVIGHEIVGVVEEVGDNAKKIKVGDRVIVDQVTACGTCYACRKGRPNVCEHLQVRGVHIDGGYREYMAVPESDVYVLPDSLSYQDAVMIEPTTIAVQACSRAQLEFQDTVMIIGAGALGSSMLRIVNLYSPRKIIVVDIDEPKLEAALQNGATDVIAISTVPSCIPSMTSRSLPSWLSGYISTLISPLDRSSTISLKYSAAFTGGSVAACDKETFTVTAPPDEPPVLAAAFADSPVEALPPPPHPAREPAATSIAIVMLTNRFTFFFISINPPFISSSYPINCGSHK